MSHIYIYIYVHIYVYICMHTDIGAFPKKSAIVYCFFQCLFGFLRGACPKSCEIACFFSRLFFGFMCFWESLHPGLRCTTPWLHMFKRYIKAVLNTYCYMVFRRYAKNMFKILNGRTLICYRYIQDLQVY